MLNSSDLFAGPEYTLSQNLAREYWLNFGAGLAVAAVIEDLCSASALASSLSRSANRLYFSMICLWSLRFGGAFLVLRSSANKNLGDKKIYRGWGVPNRFDHKNLFPQRSKKFTHNDKNKADTDYYGCEVMTRTSVTRRRLKTEDVRKQNL